MKEVISQMDSLVLVELRRILAELKRREPTDPVASYRKWKQFEGLPKETLGQMAMSLRRKRRYNTSCGVYSWAIDRYGDSYERGTRNTRAGRLGNVKIDDWLRKERRCGMMLLECLQEGSNAWRVQCISPFWVPRDDKNTTKKVNTTKSAEAR